MNVLHFYKTYYPDTVGGVEQVIYQICRGAAKHGVQSRVLSLTQGHPGNEPIQLEGHRVYRARASCEIASNAMSVSAFRLFAKLAKEADIIHYHYPWPFGDLVHFVERHGKKSVVTYHSDIVRQRMLLKMYRPLQRKFLADVDQIVATSPQYAKTSEILREYSAKITVIPIGVDKDSYPIPENAVLSKWRARVGERFFLFVGMLRYYKGLDVLLEAAAGTHHTVVIVGAGPVENKLKAHAAALQVSNIHFLGAVSDEDKVALIQLCLALVLPSNLRAEAFGVSLLEGAMFERPMISCEIGTGTSYINQHDETGLVVPPNDARALRSAMTYLAEQPGMAQKMGVRASQRYHQLFTATRMAQSYVDLYRRLLH